MFKPLLANPVDLKILEYPVMVSPKYDGFRCVINTLGNAMSRNLKPIPNGYVYAKLGELNLPPLDGELLTYTGDKVDDFNTVQSKLTTRSGRPDFRYMVFDNWERPTLPFTTRHRNVCDWFVENPDKVKHLEFVHHKTVLNEEELLDYEAECLSNGWEGIMIRSFDGPYKFGKSTTKEGTLLKMKRFFDDEAVVKGAYEFQHNSNVATVDNLGHTVRSSHGANMVGMDKLGGWTVTWKGVEFDLGVGFNDSQRVEYWQGERHVGRTIKFKYQSIGPNGKPRFPVFLGFRHESDLTREQLDKDIPF